MKRFQNLGATYLDEDKAEFLVWAPGHEKVELHIMSPLDRIARMERIKGGYHHCILEGCSPGHLYMFRLSGNMERPDPASNHQPQGVHGPSAIVDHRFDWTDTDWHGMDMEDYVIYELHIGTFTDKGTLDSAIEYLTGLRDLGITAIELTPVCQFPGKRNWGYDGVYPFSVHHDYGGPDALRRFVNSCHGLGMAVILDVVYNHLGPEGNYLNDYGPYFTDKYRTPWGSAINYDSTHSDQVRRYFIENAAMWVVDFHIDALRLDAIHGIFDFSAKHILQEMGEVVYMEASKLNRKVHIIPESDLNDSRLIRSKQEGGYNLDAQWNDDFHHCIHSLVTGERKGYYEDFGSLDHLARCLKERFVYSGQYSSYRKRKHGNRAWDLPGSRFVVFSQNHDQVGNRVLSERLSNLISFEEQKLVAGLVLLSPFIPLIFMGEEYGETAPFPYFISHGDPDLIQAVREGRKREFQSFQWAGEPMDPQGEETFQAAKLNRDLMKTGRHGALYSFYKELISLRARLNNLFDFDPRNIQVVSWEDEGLLLISRECEGNTAIYLFKFKGESKELVLPISDGKWHKVIDSSDESWKGPGATIPGEVSSLKYTPRDLKNGSFVVFIKGSENL